MPDHHPCGCAEPQVSNIGLAVTFSMSAALMAAAGLSCWHFYQLTVVVPLLRAKKQRPPAARQQQQQQGEAAALAPASVPEPRRHAHTRSGGGGVVRSPRLGSAERGASTPRRGASPGRTPLD